MSSYLNYQYKSRSTGIHLRQERRLSVARLVLGIIVPAVFIGPFVALFFAIYSAVPELLSFFILGILGITMYVLIVLTLLRIIKREIRYKGEEYSTSGILLVASFLMLIAYGLVLVALSLLCGHTHYEPFRSIANVVISDTVMGTVFGISMGVFCVSLAEKEMEIEDVLWGRYASKVKPSISLFRKESKLLSLKSFQVIQIMSTGDALALCTEETDENTFLYTEGPAVLLLADKNTPYEENRVIILPDGKVAKQVGKFTYKTNLYKINCVPVISFYRS